ncbi:MAG: hypothetical protein PHQ60_12905 [Sideroxydans sp.]|nr:hypothetical protein [Sideroxydans sp.]
MVAARFLILPVVLWLTGVVPTTLAQTAAEGAPTPESINAALARRAEFERKALSGDVYEASRLCLITGGPQRIKWCKLSAELGDYEAPFILAREYLFGWHVPADIVESMRWERISAERGSGVSRAQLGQAYLFGIGVAPDEAQAGYWIKRAARAGQRSSFYWMGWLAENGRGEVKQDYSEAIRWYQKLEYADGDQRAFFRLGMLYARGQGVAADPVKAQKYFTTAERMTRAFSNFVSGGTNSISMSYRASESRPFFADEPGQIAQARERAMQPQGDAESEFYLGQVYASGLSVVESEEESFKWFMRAAQHGHIAAQYNVGQLYKSGVGTGIGRNELEAMYWFGKASKAGDTRATYAWGMMRLYPKDTSLQDADLGLRLVREAADKGEPEAQEMLANFYALGKFVGQDLKLAEQWWQRSVERTVEMRKQQIDLWDIRIPPISLPQRINENQ